MTKLGIEPHIHPTARVVESALGRYTEIGAGCSVSHSSMGDHFYCVGSTQIVFAEIGKFANIAPRDEATAPALCTVTQPSPKRYAGFTRSP